MAESERLQDVLMGELCDVNLFCKLIKYPSIRDNMLKTFKVSCVSLAISWLILTYIARPFLVIRLSFFPPSARQ